MTNLLPKLNEISRTNERPIYIFLQMSALEKEIKKLTTKIEALESEIAEAKLAKQCNRSETYVPDCFRAAAYWAEEGQES